MQAACWLAGCLILLNEGNIICAALLPLPVAIKRIIITGVVICGFKAY